MSKSGTFCRTANTGESYFGSRTHPMRELPGKHIVPPGRYAEITKE